MIYSKFIITHLLEYTTTTNASKCKGTWLHADGFPTNFSNTLIFS